MTSSHTRPDRPISARLTLSNGYAIFRALTRITSLALLLCGCSELQYYHQAASGQLALMWQRTPIETLRKDPSIAPELKRKLDLVLRIRRFAETRLALPVDGSYEDYVDTGRPYVVWNVFAAPEFSLTPKQWCYLVIGCQSYRGYFRKQDAESVARTLKQTGWEVHVAGVSAYSTLGWFDDPVLNTFIQWPDIDLAALVFHELAHKVVYVAGDTAFNESFAMTVERAGANAWVKNEDQKIREYEAYRKRLEFRQAFIREVLETRSKLLSVYSNETFSPEEKRARKRQWIGKLRSNLNRLVRQTGYHGYDQWIDSEINNAKLAGIADYYQYIPAFESILNACASAGQGAAQYRCFYKRVNVLARKPREERRSALVRELIHSESPQR